jgi:hypothetical protein
VTFSLYEVEAANDLAERKFFAVHCSRCKRPATDEPILKSERAAICAALAQGWKVKVFPTFHPGLLFGAEAFDAEELFCPRCASEFET